MTSYIIKSILCSGILLLIYHLFLEKEKMHRFNRFYLIGSLLFALVIPMLTIELESEPIRESSSAYNIPLQNFITDMPIVHKETRVAKNIDLFEYLPVGIYALVACLLLFRFSNNLTSVLLRRKNKRIIPYQGAKLVLLPENTITYTFLDHIFIGEKDFDQKLIEKEILTHELAHVHQRHSLDVLFIELVQILFWYNPLIFFYKKAIQLNHEFLADDAVLSKYHNPKSYQLLLLDKALHTRQTSLTSSFNYSITKKRLAMMNKTTNFLISRVKQTGIVILVTCMTFLFSTREIVAQKEKVKNAANTFTVTRVEGVTTKQFDEYEATLKKMITTRIGRDGKKYTHYSMMDNAMVKKLDIIFRSMSEEQKTKATKVPFIPMLPIPEVTRPTQAQLDEWQNSKKFGVWLDERRISNAELKKYKPSDFDYYFISKLEKNAINYGKHYFQIGLSTPENFKAWQETRTPLTAIPD